jgi:CheY-like chemotaxis protein
MSMSPRILVINDDESTLEMFKLVLEPEGYAVHLSLVSSEEAKDVEVLDPSLIILDVKLGQHDEGFVLLEKLRLYPPTKHISVILCSAALEEIRQQEDTLRQKGIPIVYKPFELDELLHVIKQCLQPRV